MPSEPHKTRPLLAARHPVHVTARIVGAAPSRSPTRTTSSSTRHRNHAGAGTSRLARTSPFARSSIHLALRRALKLALARTDFRIVHVAVLRRRLELVVEADDKHALARGMQGFQVSVAKWLNRVVHRRGTVFADRYRMRILRTRTDVRALLGRLPGLRTGAWPQTWLFRIELARSVDSSRSGSPRPRRWIRSRADEDS